MKSHTQRMTFRRDVLVIATPLGLIKLRRVARRDNEISRRDIDFELPPGICVSHTEEKAIKQSKFLTKEDGVLKPTYNLLEPELDEQGDLIGLKKPEAFSIG